MAGEVLTCVQFDAQTQTCVDEAWMPAPGLVPSLSTADALLLGAAVVFNWCYAYAWNRVEKVIRH